ncbi:hypothetical protein N9210_02810 [Oceanospirillaceae bacterium]|nr:hypothetical protein [Oceanospirillaceae bacterium]
MINVTLTPSLLGRLSLMLCLSLVLSSCGFYLQGQSQRSFPPQLNLYVDDPSLARVVSKDMLQHNVALTVLDSVVGMDTEVPSVQLTGTKKHKAELILDTDGEVLIWRYTLSTNYLFMAGGQPISPEDETLKQTSMLLSVSADVDLSGTNATVNERIEADNWTLLYQQLGNRVARQLSFE